MANKARAERFQKYTDTYKYQKPSEHLPNVTEECGLGPHFSTYFQKGKAVRSRFHEDKIIYETFFKGRSTGNETFVEQGAYNGMTATNSRFFDTCLAWKGLLIEGNPTNYQKVVTSRPTAHRMSFAPSCTAEYEAINKTIPFYVQPFANTGLVDAAKTYEGRATVDVPCGPLTPVLQDLFGDQGVSFFSLDVEGAEKLVLDTVDFKAVRIDIIMIEGENDHCRARQRCQVREDVRARMEAEGYTRHTGMVKASDVYVHPQSRYQKLA